MKMSNLMIGSENPQALVEFYTKVLGEPGWQGGDFTGFDVGGVYFTIGPHDQVKGKNQEPGRLMFFLETSDVAGEYERLKGLGAEVIQEPYSPGENPDGKLATLADPDGNYFQLATPMDM